MNKIKLFFFVFLLMAPVPGFAQCEPPGVAGAAAGAVTGEQAADVTAMVDSLESSYSEDTDTATETLMDSLDEMETSILDKLDEFWNNWQTQMKLMTKQMNASVVDSSRQFASNYDASDLTGAATNIQMTEYEAKKRYQPTDEACRFDTTAVSAAYAEGVTNAVTEGYALDFNAVGNTTDLASAGSPTGMSAGAATAVGEADLKKQRWKIYQQKFCDGQANNGAAGCAASGNNPKANMHVLPSKTVFGKETIDLSDADTRDAVTQLMFNITGYQVPELISTKALKSAAGLQQRQEDREYIAQMDAVGALAYSVVADRAPGQAAPGIFASRIARGVWNASPKPSKREIRESIVEQLWDPSYYLHLYDFPGTIKQKELYLKAYSLTLLYDMIEKQEKISNVYAIETANLLEDTDHSRGAVSASAPLTGVVP